MPRPCGVVVLLEGLPTPAGLRGPGAKAWVQQRLRNLFLIFSTVVNVTPYNPWDQVPGLLGHRDPGTQSSWIPKATYAEALVHPMGAVGTPNGPGLERTRSGRWGPGSSLTDLATGLLPQLYSPFGLWPRGSRAPVPRGPGARELRGPRAPGLRYPGAPGPRGPGAPGPRGPLWGPGAPGGRWPSPTGPWEPFLAPGPGPSPRMGAHDTGSNSWV